MGINSKICPLCKEKNNPVFAVCWKCRASLDLAETVSQKDDLEELAKRGLDMTKTATQELASMVDQTLNTAKGGQSTSAKSDPDNLKLLLGIAAIVLFLATIPVWPYGYYTLLRLLVCGISAFAAYKIHKELQMLKAHKVPLIIVAVLFNPIIPVYLVRFVWFPIDIGIGIYLLFLRNKISRGEK